MPVSVSARNAASRERTRGARPRSATCSSRAISPTCSGLRARGRAAVALALDAVAAALERLGQPVRVLRADLGRGAVVAAEHLLQGALAAQLAVGDHDHVVDRLSDLGQQVAGDQHRAPLRRLLAQQPAHPADAGRIQAVGRLVEDQDLRVAEQCGGDRQALAHPSREALHAPVGCVARGRRRPSTSSTRPAGARLWRRGPAGGCGQCGPGGKTASSSTAPTGAAGRSSSW